MYDGNCYRNLPRSKDDLELDRCCRGTIDIVSYDVRKRSTDDGCRRARMHFSAAEVNTFAPKPNGDTGRAERRERGELGRRS